MAESAFVEIERQLAMLDTAGSIELITPRQMELNVSGICRRLQVRRGQVAYRERHPEMDARRRKLNALYYDLEWIGVCPYCNKPCDNPTIDHFIPVAQGGTDDVENLVLCCRACNSSKNKKTFIVWLATRYTNNVERYLNMVSHS